MYAPFFGLKQPPFSIAPDPRFLYMSERHREALAHLLYGLGGGGGFVLLTGEIGAGKTTVCRCFLEQIPAGTRIAYIFNPKLTVVELLQAVCEEFHIAVAPGARTIKDWLDPLNRYLLGEHAAGHNSVLIIDEAQNLSAEVLEQLRLLTNLETAERKLLQIILIGQPELRQMLARPELEQLAQRVIARYHLGALTPTETEQYIRHRLGVAGLKGGLPFDAGALRAIQRLARGVPRRINLLCDRALLGGYAGGQQRIGADIVQIAAGEVFADPPIAPAARLRAWRWGAGSVAAVLLAGLAVAGLNLRHAASGSRPDAAVAPLVAAAGSSPTAPTTSASAGALAAPALSGASAAAPGGSAGSGLPELTSPQLVQWLTRSSGDEAASWRHLALRWQVELPPGVDPCGAAARVELNCLRNNGGSLSLLRQLDRPVLLVLRDHQDRQALLPVLGLGSQEAIVEVGGQRQRLALQSLAALWRGEFATLWRSPPGYAQRGQNPQAFDNWLRAALASATPGPERGSEDNAGEVGATARIVGFQLSQGLRPDGLAGPITLMQLNRASGLPEPQLSVLADRPGTTSSQAVKTAPAPAPVQP